MFLCARLCEVHTAASGAAKAAAAEVAVAVEGGARATLGARTTARMQVPSVPTHAYTHGATQIASAFQLLHHDEAVSTNNTGFKGACRMNWIRF